MWDENWQEVERDMAIEAELAGLDMFRRIPPELAADPQPSTWLDDVAMHPHLPIVAHEAIPGWQLRGYRVGPNAYTLWRIAEANSRAGRPLVDDATQAIITFSLAALQQAAELLSGEILTFVQALLPTIVYFLPRERPY